MGIERTMVSAKLSPENIEFLEDLAREFRPYELSRSGLVNLCVRIVRQLHRSGQLSLEPKKLRVTLERTEIVATPHLGRGSSGRIRDA